MADDPILPEALQRLARVEVKVDGIDKNLDAAVRSQGEARRDQTQGLAEQMRAHIGLNNQVSKLSEAVAVQTESLKNITTTIATISAQLATVFGSVTELKEFRGNVLGRWSIGGAIAAVVGGIAGWAAKHWGG